MSKGDPGHSKAGAQVGAGTFQTTRWSAVISAGSEQSLNRDEALALLCRTYWYPLYAYVRGCGSSPEDAQDITQSIFAIFITSDFLSRADPQRGRFRWYLLKSLQNFLR